MICRPHDDGWLLIAQPAHAWMAGDLAAAWGNADFVSPTPFEAVVMATRLHDIGWLAWDANPRLGEDGQPVNFLNTNLQETVPVWQRAVQGVRLINPFAALLISMHATTIYGRRLERGADPPNERAQVQEALREHERLQAHLQADLSKHPVYREMLTPQRLALTYRWLRTCDLLSLAVLSGTMPQEGEIKSVPELADLQFTTLRYRQHDPFTLEVRPWPFGRPELRLPVEARLLNQRKFDSQIDYHIALEDAPRETVLALIRPSD